MIASIDENKVNEYLEDNKKRIGDSFSSTQPGTVEIKEIIGGKNKDFPDQDGVIDSSMTTYGRYCSEDKIIKINTEAIAQKLEDMRNSLYHQYEKTSQSDKKIYIKVIKNLYINLLI